MPTRNNGSYANIVPDRVLEQHWRTIQGLIREGKPSSHLGIKLRDVEQPKNVVVVGQACFAVLSLEESMRTGVERLETGGLGTCVSLIFAEPGRESVLAHVDAERMGSLEQVIEQRKFGYPEAVVAFSEHYDPSTLRQVEKFALLHADNVRIFHLGDDHAVGVGLDGMAYRIRDTVVKPDGSYYIINAYVDKGFLPRTKNELRRVLSEDPNFRRIDLGIA